ncbi:hypothetical protein [Desertibaculum subflavum]|uniref:hypothetical protein n=1 Tax=Desertibaculum subflavum TaxID=2268458 RepID=UPI0013C4B6A4
MASASDIHLQAYTGWDAARGNAPLSLAIDIDASPLNAIAAHLSLIELLPDGQFMYRQIGRQVASDFGRDFTGTIVGAHVVPKRYGIEICTAYMMVCAVKIPMFTCGEYVQPNGSAQEVSRLLLPIGDSVGQRVCTILVSRMARRSNQVAPRAANWIGSATGRLVRSFLVEGKTELAGMALAWDREDWSHIQANSTAAAAAASTAERSPAIAC